jgi:hypothetical protein
VLPKVDDMRRREGRPAEHMVEVAREVSWLLRSTKIFVCERNISKIRRNK